ncbi:MAG: hypothetical protein AAF622_05325 [Cyanobacteria bacterium P01_C01_bin.147]
MRSFSTLFISPTNADASRISDVNVPTAMAVYGLLRGLRDRDRQLLSRARADLAVTDASIFRFSDPKNL